MAIVHVKKRENPYVQIDKRVFEDTRLSWRAKGIMGYLLSKPDGWKVNVSDIWGKGKEGRNAVQDCMAELRLYGYADLITTHDANGNFTGKEWVVSEEPKGGFTDATEKPEMDNPKNRKSVFRSISNNELNSNNEYSDNDNKTPPKNENSQTLKEEKKNTPIPPAPSFAPVPENQHTAPDALAQMEWLHEMDTDPRVAETMKMAHQVPASKKDEYLAAFAVQLTGTTQVHHNRKDLRNHFFNFCRARYRAEQKEKSETTPPGQSAYTAPVTKREVPAYVD